eukprot:TRINITY_DN30415_c0_g1_i1.p1 TRINITY_DN30415_c0_g1~~TRINITY_DN30415_c0_g1_i1.p1  ORF type:complete len:300 (+),score=55.65 TRINITY_DN30415_c0_g1_i1:55-954(+)
MRRQRGLGRATIHAALLIGLPVSVACRTGSCERVAVAPSLLQTRSRRSTSVAKPDGTSSSTLLANAYDASQLVTDESSLGVAADFYKASSEDAPPTFDLSSSVAKAVTEVAPPHDETVVTGPGAAAVVANVTDSTLLVENGTSNDSAAVENSTAPATNLSRYAEITMKELADAQEKLGNSTTTSTAAPPYSEHTSTTAVLVQPVGNSSGADGKGDSSTSESRAQAALNCEVLDWRDWADCEPSAGMTNYWVQKRVRDISQPQLQGGLPCLPTSEVRPCVTAGSELIRSINEQLSDEPAI